MDRFRTALQLYKDQQGQSLVPGSQAGKTSGGQAVPPPSCIPGRGRWIFHSLCFVSGE